MVMKLHATYFLLCRDQYQRWFMVITTHCYNLKKEYSYRYHHCDLTLDEVALCLIAALYYWDHLSGFHPWRWYLFYSLYVTLTHWGRVTHICVSKLASIISDNGLSPGRRQAIIWTNAGILLIGPLGTNFSEILIGIQAFSFTKMHFKMSSRKWRPFCLGLNVSSKFRTELQRYMRTPHRKKFPVQSKPHAVCVLRILCIISNQISSL